MQHFKNISRISELSPLHFCSDGVPSSQNPTVAIDAWINHNKVEREEFSCILKENLKVAKNKFLFGVSSTDMFS